MEKCFIIYLWGIIFLMLHTKPRPMCQLLSCNIVQETRKLLPSSHVLKISEQGQKFSLMLYCTHSTLQFPVHIMIHVIEQIMNSSCVGNEPIHCFRGQFTNAWKSSITKALFTKMLTSKNVLTKTLDTYLSSATLAIGGYICIHVLKYSQIEKLAAIRENSQCSKVTTPR